ncbi:MAG: hypothetical protein JO300_11355 [Silvibacterium sp.]|nr:hypothetical protein [Silvibacterium sp.]
MRCLIALLVLSIAAPVYGVGGARVIKDLAPPPPGATLPVVINRTLKARNLRPGEPISAPLIQRVPISANVMLPRGAALDGHIVNVSNSSIGILFDHLSWKERTIPIHVRLIAAAAMMEVYDTGVPLSGPDRGTANRGDWTTRQIGGDQLFLSGGSGTVYDKYSQPVGYADYSGVYANPPAPGELPRAMGPFSTSATGLHGFPDLSIASAGGAGAPITLAASKPDWIIRNGSALLLEVVR